MTLPSVTILSKPKRNKEYTTVYTDISNGKDNLPDIAVIAKYDEDNTCYRVIIIKIKNHIGIFDLDDMIKREVFTILNYQISESSEDAYNKMMFWIGKLCKKTTSSRYFRKSDPYKRDPLNKALYNIKLIHYVKDNIAV